MDPHTTGNGAASHNTTATAFEDILKTRLSRRSALGNLAMFGAVAATGGIGAITASTSAGAVDPGSGLGFTPIEGTSADTVTLPAGYESDVVLRWGDSLVEGTADLSMAEVREGRLLEPNRHWSHQRRFGYNCDAVEFFEVPGRPDQAVVCVNHEYTNESHLFPGFGDAELYPMVADNGRTRFDLAAFVAENPVSVEVSKALHGVSVVLLQRNGDRWEPVKGSASNPITRRIHADSGIRISGPAAAHPLLVTERDPGGRWARGTLNNCAAGATPWGTYLASEENFDQYFANADGLDARIDAAVAAGEDAAPLERARDAHARLPITGAGSGRGWELGDERFDLAKHPNEAFRFGWVVEIDPLDPDKLMKKRTALGRFKHECATCATSADNRVVVYSGDDSRMEYLYKFVSADTITASTDANTDLLDTGTLYAARFEADGTGTWLPVVYGNGPLTEANGFSSQADVLIETRRAGDLLGATPMDRPEDVEAQPGTGRVYVACTNNTARRASGEVADFQGRELETDPDPANPRAGDRGNRWGHIVELTETGADHGATTFTWDIFLLCGDPDATDGSLLASLDDAPLPLGTNDTYYAGAIDPDELAPIGSPDNVSFDPSGNLWVVTDGSQPRGHNNGAFAVATDGPERGKLKQFLAGPVDSEICGAEFSADGRTLFISVQHPGDGGGIDSPTSDWPDGGGSLPRPSLIAVRKSDGGVVGT